MHQHQDQTDQLWLRGLEAYEQGDLAMADAAWRVAADEGCADALLGLHALEPDNSMLLREMYQQITDLGYERELFQKGLSSLYYPGGFQAVALIDAADLRSALALYENRCGNHEYALELLEDTAEPAANPYLGLARLRVLFENERYQDCLEQLSICAGILPTVHRPEFELIHGACLLAVDSTAEAIALLENTLAWLDPKRQDDLRLHLLYYLASAYRIEDEEKSIELLMEIYEHDQEFADVAIQLHGDDPAWTELLASLEGDMLATDPMILDNQ